MPPVEIARPTNRVLTWKDANSALREHDKQKLLDYAAPMFKVLGIKMRIEKSVGQFVSFKPLVEKVIEREADSGEKAELPLQKVKELVTAQIGLEIERQSLHEYEQDAKNSVEHLKQAKRAYTLSTGLGIASLAGIYFVNLYEPSILPLPIGLLAFSVIGVTLGVVLAKKEKRILAGFATQLEFQIKKAYASFVKLLEGDPILKDEESLNEMIGKINEQTSTVIEERLRNNWKTLQSDSLEMETGKLSLQLDESGKIIGISDKK